MALNCFSPAAALDGVNHAAAADGDCRQLSAVLETDAS
jgi:hypothetical protein